jgi:oligoribonuclease NrnB/cAMP/cGMP phosphodiesterase (DHH superfamily)
MYSDSTLITHTDLDGAACAIVGTIAGFGTIIHANYDDVDEKIADALDATDGPVYLADISPQNIGDAAWVRLIIYDHHKNSDFPARVEAGTARGAFDASKCGARILAEAVGVRSLDVARMLNIVEAWDLWLLKSPWREEAERWQRVFSFIGMERFLHRRGADAPDGMGLLACLDDEEERLSALLAEHDEAYIASRVRAAVAGIDAEGRSYRWVHASRCTSEIGQQISRDADYGAVIVIEYGKVELRSTGSCNVGAIARARGGGGHDRAAGYLLPSVAFPVAPDVRLP